MLSLADQYLEQDIFEYLTRHVVPKILHPSNLGKFVNAALLKNSENLFNICCLYWLHCSRVENLMTDDENQSQEDTETQDHVTSVQQMMKNYFVTFV